MADVLWPLDTGRRAVFLGSTNHGDTLDTAGMLFVNRLSWAHVLKVCARSMAIDLLQLRDEPEIDTLEGRRDPQGTIA